jgi:hypothetical protein
MRPELDFQTADVDEIVALYLSNGCVLLRRFCDVTELQRLREKIDIVHQDVDDVHVYPSHLYDHGLKLPQEYLFSEKHYNLLEAVYGDLGFRYLEGNVSRRMDAQGITVSGWQAPLPPHLDAFVHPPGFTVNFWIPLQPCGVELPSLGVVCTDFDDVLDYTGYSESKLWNDEEEPNLYWGNFRPEMKAMWDHNVRVISDFNTRFSSSIWLPEYDVGDVMMSSNWTLHFTHALENMEALRVNLEIRFITDASLRAVRFKHSGVCKAP